MCALILVTGCSGGGDEGERPPSRATLVRVAPVLKETVRPTTSAVGTVVARRTSIVASGANGKVNRFLVQEGDVVEEGQELWVLNMLTTGLEIEEAEAILVEKEQMYQASLKSRPEEINEAKARMEAAESTSRITAEQYKRFQGLARGNAIDENTLADAREKAEAASKMYNAAQAQYELMHAGPRDEVREQAKASRDAQKLHVDYLMAERDKRTARAPFRGIVVEQHTEAGQWLDKGDTVVTIADLLDKVHVIANVDQRELSNVQIGAEVDVEVEGATPSRCTGVVEAIIPRSQWKSGSRTFPVKVALHNSSSLVDGRMRPALTEGMLARITFSGPEREAVLIPKNALIRTETMTRLYAAEPGEQAGTARAKLIILQEGMSFGDRVESLGGDLQPGTNVVVEGGERLIPNAELKIQADDPAPDGPPAKP